VPPPPEENREFALLCPHCGEENPPEFPACWSCHGDLTGAPAAAKEQPAEPDAHDPAAIAARRKRIAVELGVGLAVVWLPSIASGIWSSGEAPPPRDLSYVMWSLFQAAGILALIAYFAWLDGDWRRMLGLGRPRIVAEAVWSLIAFFAFFIAHDLAYRLTVVFGEMTPEPHLFEEQVKWLALPYFLVWAAVEEAFYRAYVWTRLSELSRRPWLSIVVTALLFSASHGYPLLDSVSIFFMGLALGGIFWARRSLWPLVLGHCAFNVFLTFSYP
jgi:membrane protease YdiL (CAAX protease family)